MTTIVTADHTPPTTAEPSVSSDATSAAQNVEIANNELDDVAAGTTIRIIYELVDPL